MIPTSHVAFPVACFCTRFVYFHKTMRLPFQKLAAIYARVAALALVVGFVLRIVLLFNEQTVDIDFSFGEWVKIYLLGAVNDLMVVTLGGIPLLLFMASITEQKYRRPWGWLLLGVLVAALCYVLFFNSIFHQYSGAARRIATAVIAYWCASFALRLFLPRVRPYWSRGWFAALTIIYVGAILFNGVSEYFFWNEFGVRYNFIAVDYLVYTHEVVGNIMESYPILPIAGALIAITLTVWWLLFRGLGRIDESLQAAPWRRIVLPLYGVMCLVAVGIISFNLRFQQSPNVYANELQANGLQRFYDAFLKNELAYRDFYPTCTETEAEAFLRATYQSEEGVRRTLQPNVDAPRRNLVLITLESMSAEYMARFGNTESLTPNLDSLYQIGLGFDRVYATGNRTVRGLEALTLSLPPCPGQSIIKRKDNTSCLTVGELLAEQGYTTCYFYGGNAYFDNMESFFGGNGYSIVDQRQYSPEEITFRNIWGVCDEDSYRKAIRTINTLSEEGAPFFAHIMSVSNHRPFTYPAGKISIPHDIKSRKGGVMYSDYALGEFFRAAAKEPWFENTIFLVAADHCASSAGSTEIPLEKYHIPALIYAPGVVAPQIEERMVSQIDLMPTLLDVAGIGYESPFYGRSIFEEGYTERAFVATYQDLGYVEGDRLTILSPVRRVKQLRIVPTEENPHALEPIAEVDSVLLQHAVAYYQSAE